MCLPEFDKHREAGSIKHAIIVGIEVSFPLSSGGDPAVSGRVQAEH
jgi:hypothetical protein